MFPGCCSSYAEAPKVFGQESVGEDRLGFGEKLQQAGLGVGFVAGADMGEDECFDARIPRHGGSSSSGGMAAFLGTACVLREKCCFVD